MKGDALASGARSATFAVAPNLKFDEAQMRKDLMTLPAQAFINKYMIHQTEYDRLVSVNSEDEVNSFAEQMKRVGEFYERGLALDEKQEDSLKRECFLTPCLMFGFTGRVIVDRDVPPKKKSNIRLPQSMTKEKTLLPTTGHIIKATIISPDLKRVDDEYVGKRILFNQMSGSAICFKGYPTWIQLELSEILCWVNREDVEVVGETLESMV